LGDMAAFTRLVERYTPRLTYFVRRLVTGDTSAADDVVQETWMIVFRKLGSLEDHDSFGGWLYGIARRTAMKHSGRTRRRGGQDLVEATGEAEDVQLSAEDAQWVHAGLNREVLTLRFLEEMSYEQIARIVGCSVGTVRSRLHYAKRALREILESTSHGTGKNAG
jgi:RNA polymerase sigma-70 factor, ECF subfamily